MCFYWFLILLTLLTGRVKKLSKLWQLCHLAMVVPIPMPILTMAFSLIFCSSFGNRFMYPKNICIYSGPSRGSAYAQSHDKPTTTSLVSVPANASHSTFKDVLCSGSSASVHAPNASATTSKPFKSLAVISSTSLIMACGRGRTDAEWKGWKHYQLCRLCHCHGGWDCERRAYSGADQCGTKIGEACCAVSI